MKICFPARKKGGKEYTSVDDIMTQVLGEPHGGWLAGSNLLWHGGLHISTVTAPDSILTAETVDTAVPLQFMAGGEVVAWRLNKEYLTSQYNGQTLQYSTTFVLVKSVCQPDPKNDKTWLEFYTLYMGLAPLSEFPETACWSVTDKGDGLRKRQYSGAEKEGRKAPIPAGGSLKKGTRVAVMKQTVFELDGKSQAFGLAKALNEKGEITGKPFWISLAPDYMKKESPQYAHLPVWMQQAVKQGTFDEVVRPAEKLEVAAGDAAGFLSKDVDPVGMGKVGSSHFVHIEVLSSDVRMPAFLDNPGKITVGKQYIRVHSGKSVYQKTGSGEASTFKAMSCVIVKDSGKILPADKCHPLKDAQGKTWYEISPGNWMSESDVDVLHQYDLKERGFTALKEESTADMSKSLREGWMKSLLNRLSEMVNRERGIQQQQVSDYYKKAVNHIDTDGDGELSSEELFYAVHHPEMEIRNITARMVVKHDSEWSGDSSHHKWEVYFKNYDLLRMQYAKQWRDDVEWMSQVEAFKGGASVWHMHPVIFLDTLNGSSCACDRNMTLEELQKFIIGVNADTLSSYLTEINNGFKKFGITTCREKAHFLAQVLHESGNFRFTKEIHGERASYQPWFGRGLIQITLRANYEKYGEYIGEDVTSGDSARDKLTRLPHSVLSAFWYYDVSRQLGGLAKSDDFNKVTAVINGGFNGYNDRLSIFNSAVKSLGGGHLNKQCTNGAFSFENSSIYQSKIYSLAWGLWHDPFSHRSGTDKNADEALKGYKRAKELLASSPFPTSTPHKKIYGIEYVSVLEYINQRIGVLQ